MWQEKYASFTLSEVIASSKPETGGAPDFSLARPWDGPGSLQQNQSTSGMLILFLKMWLKTTGYFMKRANKNGLKHRDHLMHHTVVHTEFS